MITAAADAPAGTVRNLPFYAPSDFPLGSAILCRNNAPLVAHAFAAIRRSLPVRILGRELGAGLTKIIKSWKVDFDWPERAEQKLFNWYSREEKRCRRKSQHAALADRHACLASVVAATTSEADAVAAISRLFVDGGDATSCVTLSTGHKAKGQEWDDVFILNQHLIPSKWAEDLDQERNLLYVMVTRAKLNLTYITSNRWK